MKTRTLFATLAIPATAAGLFAQHDVLIERKQAAEKATMMAQGAIGMIGLSGEPGNLQFITQELTINGRTVANAPYSADEKTESVQTLADGTRIINATTSKMYRDSQGRTRRELTLPTVEGMPAHTMITISDPVAGVNYTLDSRNKMAHKMPAPGFAFRGEMEAKVKAEMESIRTREPAVRAGSASTMSYRVVQSRGPAPNSKREDLAPTIIEGVNVTGNRETTTIEAGAMGNDRPIVIKSERWYSPELQVEVKSVRDDPRMGVTTHTLSNINRSEPDATLFQVPSDYTLQEPKFSTGPDHVSTFEYRTNEHKF